jgi:hypothetical protein
MCVARGQQSAAAAGEATPAEQLLLANRGLYDRGGKLQPTS